MAKRRREMVVAKMKEVHEKEVAFLRRAVKTNQKKNWNTGGGGATYDIIRRKTPRRKNSLGGQLLGHALPHVYLPVCIQCELSVFELRGPGGKWGRGYKERSRGGKREV